MKRDDIKLILDNITPLSASLRFQTLKDVVFTGSWVFGGYDPKISDIDCIMPFDFNNDLYTFLINPNNSFIKTDEYDGTADVKSIYVLANDNIIYNLLFMRTKVIYDNWVLATLITKRITSNAVIRIAMTHKPHRVELFALIKKLISTI